MLRIIVESTLQPPMDTRASITHNIFLLPDEIDGLIYFMTESNWPEYVSRRIAGGDVDHT
jgi:hypothetical protein